MLVKSRTENTFDKNFPAATGRPGLSALVSRAARPWQHGAGTVVCQAPGVASGPQGPRRVIRFG